MPCLYPHVGACSLLIFGACKDGTQAVAARLQALLTVAQAQGGQKASVLEHLWWAGDL